MEQFIMADGCATRVRVSGDGPRTILLLHGYLETIEVWEDFIPLLEGVRTVAIDLPGHGISEVKGPVHTMEFLARTARGALQQLGVDRCVVAGHSMGGYAALEFLSLFPEAAEGIALLHSTPDGDTPEKRALRQREIELVESGKKELIARVNPGGRFAPENRRRLAGRVEEMSEVVYLAEDAGILALLRGMEARRDTNEVLRRSGVPQLFVFGRHDEMLPAEYAEKIAAAHPRAQVLWLEHSGHMGFVEEPQITARALLDFAAALPGPKK